MPRTRSVCCVQRTFSRSEKRDMAKSKLPYRPCVGQMVINRRGRVWVGRRADAKAGRRLRVGAAGGRCRKAASTTGEDPARRRCANSRKKPASARSRSSPRAPAGCLRSAGESSAGGVGRALSRPEAKMVRVRFHGRRRRGRSAAAGPPGRVRCLALGRYRRPGRPDRALQARACMPRSLQEFAPLASRRPSRCAGGTCRRCPVDKPHAR